MLCCYPLHPQDDTIRAYNIWACYTRARVTGIAPDFIRSPSGKIIGARHPAPRD